MEAVERLPLDGDEAIDHHLIPRLVLRRLAQVGRRHLPQLLLRVLHHGLLEESVDLQVACGVIGVGHAIAGCVVGGHACDRIVVQPLLRRCTQSEARAHWVSTTSRARWDETGLLGLTALARVQPVLPAVTHGLQLFSCEASDAELARRLVVPVDVHRCAVERRQRALQTKRFDLVVHTQLGHLFRAVVGEDTDPNQ